MHPSQVLHQPQRYDLHQWLCSCHDTLWIHHWKYHYTINKMRIIRIYKQRTCSWLNKKCIDNTLTPPNIENLNFVTSLLSIGWIAAFSPVSNTEQIALTLKLFDEQSIGIPVYVLEWAFFLLFLMSFRDKPLNRKSIALPVQNGVVGCWNMMLIASDIIGSSGFRFTLTASASEVKTGFRRNYDQIK